MDRPLRCVEVDLADFLERCCWTWRSVLERIERNEPGSVFHSFASLVATEQ